MRRWRRNVRPRARRLSEQIGEGAEPGVPRPSGAHAFTSKRRSRRSAQDATSPAHPLACETCRRRRLGDWADATLCHSERNTATACWVVAGAHHAEAGTLAQHWERASRKPSAWKRLHRRARSGARDIRVLLGQEHSPESARRAASMPCIAPPASPVPLLTGGRSPKMRKTRRYRLERVRRGRDFRRRYTSTARAETVTTIANTSPARGTRGDASNDCSRPRSVAA